MDAPFQLDPHQQIAWDCPVCAVVLGKAAEFFLIPLHFDEHAQEVITEIAKQRGYSYAGVMGATRDGQCSAKVEPANPEAACVMMHAAFAFALLYVAPLLKTEKKDDSADWLRKLMALKDPRAN